MLGCWRHTGEAWVTSAVHTDSGRQPHGHSATCRPLAPAQATLFLKLRASPACRSGNSTGLPGALPSSPVRRGAVLGRSGLRRRAEGAAS